MPTARPIEKLIWLLNPSHYDRFEHWIQAMPIAGQVRNQLRLFTALRPYLKRMQPGKPLPKKDWEAIALAGFGELKNPASAMQKQCSLLIRSLSGYFAMLEQHAQPAAVPLAALQHCPAATFPLIHQLLSKRAGKVIEQNPLSQTPGNLHTLAVQLHTYALCHRAAMRPAQLMSFQDDRRRKEAELGIFTLYKLAIVYLNRETMLSHLGEVVVDFLDQWRPEPQTNSLLSLYHKAYGMTVGPIASEVREDQARAFKEELQALEDQLGEEDFATLGVLAFKAFWKLYVETKAPHCFFDLGGNCVGFVPKSPISHEAGPVS